MINEEAVERTALAWFENLGYAVLHGAQIAPGEAGAERAEWDRVVLERRLLDALEVINPEIPPEAVEGALRAVLALAGASLVERNRAFHRLLTDGVDVSWMEPGGMRHDKVWLLDTGDIDNNDWLVVNQFTVAERHDGRRHERRPDLVVFVNGLPLAVVELKSPSDEGATLRGAFDQLQTYKGEIAGLFAYNALLLVSDGMQARLGTLTAGWDRFMPWRTIDGTDLYREPGSERQSEGTPKPGLEVMVKGVFERRRLIDYLLNFITFEEAGEGSAGIAKKAAGYHQFHAVNKALEHTLSACGLESPPGLLVDGRQLLAGADRVGEPAARYGPGSDHFGGRRIGVVWHTQGSGKSLTMSFYAGKVIKHPAMDTPTVVVVTDRNDLDDQLFLTFAHNRALLRQTPHQAVDRHDLRARLKVASGGVVFTTVQKFLPDAKGDEHPRLSERSNIVVIADEAHRSQYDFIDGFARHLHDALPNASFIGFTGTPVEADDRSTPAVFGDYIDTYDLLQAVEDGATVRIYYESRLAKLALEEGEIPRLDTEFEAITEAEEEEARRQRMRTKWASLEAMVGSARRIAMVAEDLVAHFERCRESLVGKAMVVGMSRRICVELFDAIVKLRPEWHDPDDAKGRIKIVMSGSASDEAAWQPHIRAKGGREALARRFKDPADPLQLVIVRDMWLTGFDCPSLHTLYVDKPMGGHNLMQAIARVNRVFRDKPGGLVVDYLGLADSLKRALADYTASGGRGRATLDQEEAVAVMREKHEVVLGILHGFDYAAILTADTAGRMQGMAEALEFIFRQEEGRERYLSAVLALSKAFALAVPHEAALAIRDEVGLFQAIRTSLVKSSGGGGRSPQEMEAAVRLLVSRAVAPVEVVDLFAAAGMEKPDISILSDSFLAEVRELPQRNLALEVLRKLLNDEIKTRMRRNVVQSRAFSEMLAEAVRKYQNRAIEAAEVIEELIRIARELREARLRGESLGLSEDESAFYDALEVNDSAVRVMGDEKLKLIARELVGAVRRNVSIDWTVRESARAKIRVLVKRILRRYGYPPDLQEGATRLVLEQAEVLCPEWLAEADG
ncbi:type I restriction endonuclease subunit R [Endothiovibrio diazotrophicus]